MILTIILLVLFVPVMWLAINLPVILHRREQRKGWKKIENLYKHYGQQVPPEVLKANEYYKKK